MPELPEVETVRLALVPAMEGRWIGAAHVGRPDLRWPLPDNLAARLTGRMVGPLARRGKFLLVSLDGDETMLMHLGMSGSVRIHHQRPAIGKHDHMVLEMQGAASPCWVVFNDPRRFGWIDLFSEDIHPMLADMGPEPLANEFSAATLIAGLAARRGPVKTALLDQRLVAGIGNIYACEALFGAGISPRRRGYTIRRQRADRLAAAIRDVLTRAIEDGGTSLRDHVQPGGEIGYFVQRLSVYGRAGESCRACGTTIRSLVQSGRSSFYCPDCQR